MTRNLAQKKIKWGFKTPPHAIFTLARALVIAGLWLGFFSSSTSAQNISQAGWPVFWRPFDTSNPPSSKGYRVLNFAVDISHPPFSYKDATGRITGLGVELARTICQDNGFTCRFEPVAWEDIPERLSDGRADISISSLKINQKAREKLVFSNRYFLNPARFLSVKSRNMPKSDPETMSGKNIAVMGGSAHEAFLKKYFSSSDIIVYENREVALRDMRGGKVDAFFSDGISLLFWMNSPIAQGCCSFIPGAYTHSLYFGEGIGFSTSKKNARLARIFNYSLERLRRSGVLERLYQIHFPGPVY